MLYSYRISLIVILIQIVKMSFDRRQGRHSIHDFIFSIIIEAIHVNETF